MLFSLKQEAPAYRGGGTFTDFHIGKIISVKMTGNRPTYNIMLLDGKVIEVETNTFIKLYHDQIMRAANDRTFLQLSEEVKR